MIYWISLTYILLWMLFMESTSTLNKKLRFKEGSCDGPFTLTPQENLTITHVTSTTASVFCQDLALSGWDSINSKQREVCVKLIKNQLDCSQRLEYRVRNYDASPSKLYDCKDSPGQTPVYCTFDTLYIKVNSDGLEKKTTQVTYTVYSGREQIADYNSSSSSTHVAIIVGVLGLFVAILVPVICIRLKKARDMQNQDRVVTYRRNQQPRIKVVHHYHQVDRHGNQDTLPGSEPVSGQNNPPQVYTTPARSFNQFARYPPSSAPIGYQLSPIPHIISPHTSLSVEQQSTVTCKPPSYEEVLKQT